MADENGRHTVGLQLANNSEQSSHFIIAERGSRLIHNHQLALERDSTGNSHHLLSSSAIGIERFGYIERDMQLFQQGIGLGIHFAPVEQAPAKDFTSQKN